MKRWLVIIGVLVVIALVIWLVGAFLKGDDMIIIETPQGEVKLPNFYPLVVQVDGETALIKESTRYHIVYFSEDQSFLVTLLALPLDEARVEAEVAFLDTFKVSKEDACKLNVSLKVPLSVSEEHAGIDYGLSFCEDGRAL